MAEVTYDQPTLIKCLEIAQSRVMACDVVLAIKLLISAQKVGTKK